MKTPIRRTDFQKKHGVLLSLAVLLAGCGGSTNSTSPAALQPKLGTYGSRTDTVSLLLNSGGGTLHLPCETLILTEPVTVDSLGNFDVPAYVQFLGQTPHTSPVPPTLHVVGSVRGNTVTLTEQFLTDTFPTYKLVFGQQPPPFTGTCGAS